MNIFSSKIDTSDKPTKIYPLPHMYVVKDLVPDMNQFYEQYRSVQPWLQRDDEKNLGSGDKQLLQSTEDRQKLVSDSMNLSFTMYLRMVFSRECFYDFRTASTSASCAPAAQLRARPTGGTWTGTWAPPC